jgi:RNA polymerase sigma-70 factor (ECF subfamily)
VGTSAERPTPAQRGDAELAELIGCMAQGDAAALAAFYDATSAMAHGLALRIVRDPGAAEEVVMDVYTQAFLQADSYDPLRGTPWAWLLTMARTRAIDRVRAEKSCTRHQEPLDRVAEFSNLDPDPEAASSVAERGRLVRAAIARLSARPAPGHPDRLLLRTVPLRDRRTPGPADEARSPDGRVAGAGRALRSRSVGDGRVAPVRGAPRRGMRHLRGRVAGIRPGRRRPRPRRRPRHAEARCTGAPPGPGARARRCPAPSLSERATRAGRPARFRA